MANNLISPGVQVSVLDDSGYAPNAVGTVPLIVLATAQDKLNAAGSLAAGTLKENAGVVYNVSDQRSLVNLFGLPVFPTDASGNRIYGDERSEYGLWSAHNILDTISSAYIIRADIDLAQLGASRTRPMTSAAGGTLWLDSAVTHWGIFEWDADNQKFVQKSVSYITNTTTEVNNDKPRRSYGNIGDYAIVGTLLNNPLYYKAYNGDWVAVGSTSVASGNTLSWVTAVPTITAGNASVSNLTTSNTIVINGTPVTASGATAELFAADINLSAISGIQASVVAGKLRIYASALAASDGTHADGKITIANGSGTILTKLGIVAGTYAGPIVQFSKHSTVPQWKTFNTTPRPSGSVWVKTSNFNYGANIATYRRNAVTETWDLTPSLLFANDWEAIATLDPTRGGLGIAKNSLYTRYASGGITTNPSAGVVANGVVDYQQFIRYATGPTTINGTVSNPTLTGTDAFTIRASQVGSTTLTSAATIVVGANSSLVSVYGVANLINAANIGATPTQPAVVSASVDSSQRLVLTHLKGGVLVLDNTVNTPLDDMGITTDISTGQVRANYDGTLIVSNFIELTAGQIIQQGTEPTAIPVDGTLWYSYGFDADIMINSNNVWKGYRTVTADARGYDLSATDPLGPIFSPSKPTEQQTDPVTGVGGSALVYGDLWIDTGDLENYPQIWRWQSVLGVDQWVKLDTSSSTEEDGVLFADARWDTDGTTDIFIDDLPPIAGLLLSNNTDLDAPDPELYPNGCLLFNTRRSTLNVKEYVQDYYTVQNFPTLSLPAVKSTWKSHSGKKYNNVPYFGRQAQRNVIVSAMKQAVDNSVELLEQGRVFNLLAAPGYPELLVNLKELNDNRKNTGFIIGEVPMGLATDTTTVENYLIDAVGSGLTGEDGITINDPYVAVYYPGAATVNSLDGVGSVAVPMSAVMLRTIIRSDQNGEIWFAPAGDTRGVVDVTAIGFVDRQNNNAFVRTGTPQGMRDLLYTHNVNPVAYFQNTGYIAYGNHTRQAAATALDRINVARLVAYLRYELEKIMRPLIFEPNDKLTRDKAKALVDSLMQDIVTRRGVYDFLTVCDRTNNTNATIDRNELHLDLALSPVKSVEYIYVPVRLKGTGQISGGNATSVPLG